jgi:hypothetical protein
MSSRPHVEWAFFCEYAEAVGQGFSTAASRIKHTAPRLRGDIVGVAMLLVFGVTGLPNTVTPLRLTLVSPGGRQQTREVLLESGETGFAELRADVASFHVADVGELRAEFRFGNETEASHVATLAIVDGHFSILARPPTGAAQVH